MHRVLVGDATRPRLSLVTAALAPRADGPPTASFSSCRAGDGEAEGEVEAVRARDFLTRRVALHRVEYAKERGLASVSALRSESERVKALKV